MNKDWQPIETAPRDGTLFMLLSPERHIGIGYIERNYAPWTSPGYHDSGNAAWGGRTEDRRNGPGVWLGMYSPMQATHWMPLPPPPEQTP